MKKALPIALVILALVALLMACGQSADEPPTTTPDPAPTPSVEQTQPVETPAPTPAPTAEPMNAVLREDMTQEELIDFFEIAHDCGEIWAGLGCNEDEVLAYELEDLARWRDLRDDLIFPEDLDAQYLAWREANYPKAVETPATTPEVQVPSNNTQTQPNVNNQTQPANNQTGPGGAIIVNDPTFVPGADEAPKADLSQIKTAEEQGWRPIAPGEIEYGD